MARTATRREKSSRIGGAILGLVGAIAPNVHGADAPTRASSVAFRFDFDERGAGNVDEVPMYWEALRLPGFPAFAEGRFDESVGHVAAPSFHLSSAGRNVAYAYFGSQTQLHGMGSYRVQGYVRPDRLTYARACLSAHFLDQRGGPLLGTFTRSRFVGGPESRGQWESVDLHLSPPPPEALSISVAVWVLQDGAWRPNTAADEITHADVHGGAWFDDITIFRIPHAGVRCTSPGNVLTPEDAEAIEVWVAEGDGGLVNGEVRIQDAEGRLVHRETVNAHGDGVAARQRIGATGLGPGLHQVTLDVLAQGAVIATHALDFVSVGDPKRAPGKPSRRFGVVLDQSSGDPTIEVALLERLGVRSVKVPVGIERPREASLATFESRDRFYQELGRRSFSVTAVLSTPPSPIAAGNVDSAGPLAGWLGSDTTGRPADLKAIAARYASIVQWWQLGEDGRPGAGSDQQFGEAVGNVRDILSQFITAPRLAAVVHADQLGYVLPVDQVAFALGVAAPPSSSGEAVQAAREAGYAHVSAYVAPLPAEEYVRLPRLAEFAQRMISARHAGADTVFVPQPWHLRFSANGPVVEPGEEFVVVRTIAEMVGDAAPGRRLSFADGVSCLAFHNGERNVLAMWDSLAPPEGRAHPWPLGPGERVIDLWGRTTRSELDEGGRPSIRLSPLPVFIEGLESWIVDLVHSVKLSPGWVNAGHDVVHHAIEFGPAGRDGLWGTAILDGPESLEITPRSFDFRAGPSKPARLEFTVRYPHSEPAGRKTLALKLYLGPDPPRIEVPLTVDVGLSDVDAWATAVVEGRDLVLRHVVRNHSSSVLSFRGSALAPGRERQYRPFSNLAPEESQSVEYRISEGISLIGRRVRLMLHELNDGPRVHAIELIVP